MDGSVRNVDKGWIAAGLVTAGVVGGLMATAPRAALVIALAPFAALLVGRSSQSDNRSGRPHPGVQPRIGERDRDAYIRRRRRWSNTRGFIGRCAHRVASGRPLRPTPGLAWFGAYAAIGFLGAFWNGVPISLATEGCYLASKSILFGLAVAQVDWTEKDIKLIARLAAAVVAAILVCTLLNLVLLGTWAYHFQSWHFIEHRYGLPSLVGPFVHPSLLGNFLSLAAIAILGYRALIAKSPGSAVLLVGTVVGSLFSLRWTAFTGLMLGGVLVKILIARVSTVIAVAIIVPAIAIAGWGAITETAASTYQTYVVESNTRRAEHFDGRLYDGRCRALPPRRRFCQVRKL